MENKENTAAFAAGEQLAEEAPVDTAAAGPAEEGIVGEGIIPNSDAEVSLPQGPPQAAAPSGAAGAERASGAEAPPAAAEALHLIRAAAEWMKTCGITEKEMALLTLREELEKEKRLRLLSENKLTCLRALETAQIPASFADLLVTEDGAETEARTAAFIDTAREWINREISHKLETLAPRIGGGSAGITRAQFRAMRIAEQQELYRTNRPLYEELSRQGKKG